MSGREEGIVDSSGKFGTGIDPVINSDVVKCIVKKNLNVKHNGKIEGCLSPKRYNIST